MESVGKVSERSQADADKRHYVLLDVFLLLFWFLLTGTLFSILTFKNISFITVAAGIISASAVTFTVHRFVIRGTVKSKSSSLEYLKAMGNTVLLILDVIIQLIIANAILFYQSLSMRIEPRIVKVRVNLESDAEVTLISSLITLIPGTLVIDAESGDESWYYLYIHFSYLKSDDLEENIENTINRWDGLIRGIFR